MVALAADPTAAPLSAVEQQAADFLRHLRRFLPANDESCVELRAFPISGGPPVRRWFSDPDDAARLAISLRDSYNVYAGVNPRVYGRGDKGGVPWIVCLHADSDAKIFDDDLDAAFRAVDNFRLEPTCIVRSGNGYHAYWLLDDPLPATQENVTRAEGLMRRLYQHLGGLDGVQDASRVLRLPGSINHKAGTLDRDVRVVYTSDTAYTLDDFDSILPAASEPAAWRQEPAAVCDAEYDEPPPLDRLREMLACVPPTLPYREWVDVVMAVKSAYPAEDGFGLIDEWSTEARENAGQQTLHTGKFDWWKLAVRDITLGTLYHYATEGGWEPPSGPKLVVVERGARPARRGPAGGARLALIPASEIKPESVAWLWPGRIPYSMLTMLEGDPGLGKSAITVDLAARVSAGTLLQDGTPVQAGGVLILAAEDHYPSVIVPRLEAAGADLGRVYRGDVVEDESGERQVRIPGDVPLIEEAVERCGIRLVIIDPIRSFTEPVKEGDDNGIRRLLNPLVLLAQRTGVAVLMLRHLNKDRSMDPLYRGGGGIGWAAVCRSVLAVGKHPDTPDQFVLLRNKGNLSAPPEALAYRLEGALNGAVRVAWQGKTNVTAERLLGQPATSEEQSELDEAREFLRAVLRDGSRGAKEVEGLAAKQGIAKATLRRAKEALGVSSHRFGFGADSHFKWFLPPAAIDAHSPDDERQWRPRPSDSAS